MPLAIAQNATAVGPRMPASFVASGGTAPYEYSVVAGGAGGTIDASSGLYTAPAVVNPDPAKTSDTILVTDYAAATATVSILVGTPLLLLCEIIQRGMQLANGRVYLWDQKIFQPKDYDLYIAVGVANSKVFGASTRMNEDDEEERSVNIRDQVEIDLISRGPAARDRRGELVSVLNGFYSRRQQDANAFNIGVQPNTFTDLSRVDGAAIPYRFKISVGLLYCVTNAQATTFYDQFDNELVVDTGQDS